MADLVVGRAGAGVAGLVVDERAFAARVGGAAVLVKLLRKLTVTAKPLPGAPHRGPPIRRAAFERAGGSLRMPRRLATALLASTGAAPPALDRVDGAAADFRPLPVASGAGAAPLFAYQAAAAEHLAGLGGPLAPGAFPAVAYLQLDPGLGKTRVGLAVAARRGGPACVVVPTKAIAEQWLDEAAAMFPGWAAAQFANSSKRARAVGAATHDLVVVVVNTFRDMPPEFAAGFATVILDEAHELCSKENSKALWVAQAGGGVLGLSATPLERPDGLDRLVAAHLGAPIAAGDVPAVAAGVDSVAWRARVRAIEFAGDPDFARTVAGPGGTASAILTIASAAADPARVKFLTFEIARLARAHELPPGDPGRAGLPPGARHGVFVFAEHREFLHTLRDALAGMLDPGDIILADDSAADDSAPPGGRLPLPLPLPPPIGHLSPDSDPDSDPESDSDRVCDMYADADPDPVVSDDDTSDDEPAPPDDEPAPSDDEPAPPDDEPAPPDDAPAKQIRMPISVLRGGAAAGEVGRARAAGAHVVLTTYGYSRRGISLPEMTALVLATPRRNGSRQILGRVFRRGGDPAIERVIVDVIDVRTCLKGQYRDRRKIYNEKGWAVERVLVSGIDLA